LRGEIARPALDIQIVAEAGPLQLDCTFQHFLDDPQQPGTCLARYASGLCQRMNAGFEQRFVGVDVAKP
jgi:hypothetical protein